MSLSSSAGTGLHRHNVKGKGDGLPSAGPLRHLVRFIFYVFLPALAGVAMWTLWRGWFSPVDLALFVGFYLMSGLGITLGYHRFFTHQSFRTTRWIAWLLGVMGSMAVQGPVIWWVSTHRVHHQHSDDDEDPHSPHAGRPHGFGSTLRGFVHAHIGWALEYQPRDRSPQVRDLLADPLCVHLDAWFPFWGVFGMVAPAVIGGCVTQSWWGALSGFLWGGVVRVFLVHHVTWSVNSICHLWGSRDFESRDQSRNNVVVGLLAVGEGWHNNHHAFPYSARHGLQWWQFDLSWIVIRILSALGLTTHVRTVPLERIEALRRRQHHPGTGALESEPLRAT
jgi:stearoyl-CoA desaturase (delta-9 desaturase)